MSEIKFKKRDERDVLAVKESAGVTYLSFPALENTGLVSHAFPPVWEASARETTPP